MQKSNKGDWAFKKDFEYSHNNPYHERLSAFSEFVMRDTEAESFQGSWKEKVFQNDNPIHLEIGTGYGQFMSSFCEQNPSINFVGLDYRFKRSFALAKKLSQIPEKNFKYLRAKGERVHFLFSENELDRIYYFFPDPWPKTRHHKKRLFQASFLENCSKVLKPAGELFIKTDHDQYFEWMLEFVHNQKLFDIELKSFDMHSDHPDHLLSTYKTKFEKIFMKKNIKTKAMVLINKGSL